jgi:hypothetical protein
MNSTTTFVSVVCPLQTQPIVSLKCLQINPGLCSVLNSKLSFPGFPAPCDRHY